MTYQPDSQFVTPGAAFLAAAAAVVCADQVSNARALGEALAVTRQRDAALVLVGVLGPGWLARTATTRLNGDATVSAARTRIRPIRGGQTGRCGSGLDPNPAGRGRGGT